MHLPVAGRASLQRQFPGHDMLVTIATFSFPHEAHIAKAKLDALGIPSFIADEHTINMQWLYSDAMGGVRLQVPREVAAEALEALAEDASMEAESNPDGGLHSTPEPEPDPEADVNPAPEVAACPQCGGALGAPYAEGKRPAILTWLVLGLPLWPVRQVRKCTACGKTTTV
jgi:hypothetical protein